MATTQMEGFDVVGDDDDEPEDEPQHPLNERDQLALGQLEEAVGYLRRGMPGAAVRRGTIAVNMIAATHDLTIPHL